MRIFRHHEGLPTDVRGAAVALGNFDGVHRAHQVVINTAGDHARRLGVPHGIVTFEPHPRQVFSPDGAPFRLTPFRIKARYVEELGLDVMFNLHFDKDFAARSAENFISEVLIGALGVRHLSVGWDFVFGKGRAGNAEILREKAEALGAEVAVVNPVQALDDGVEAVISSTRIRAHLQAGEPREAAFLLGRPWEIEGRVDHGDHRGRTISFPTANVMLGDHLRPKAGVYAVRIGVERAQGVTEWHNGVANIGTRPTVGGTDLRLEANIFDFSEDLYGHYLRVALIGWIRPEQRFSGLDQLKAQITLDAETARNLLSAAR